MKLLNKGENFKREVWTRKKAIDFFSTKGELYKVELINDIPRNRGNYNLQTRRLA